MLRALFIVAFLALALLYYYFFGPGPTASELSAPLAWWRPRGWVMYWPPVTELWELARTGVPGVLLPIALFCLPPLALFALGLRLLRSPPARAALLSLTLTLVLCVIYGYVAGGGVWRFFSWRFFATILALCALASSFAFAPALLARLRAQPRGRVAAALLASFAGIFLLTTEITGTDESLPLNVSPWAALSVFGLLLFGQTLALLHVAAGAGAWLGARVGRAAGALVAFVMGALAALWIFGRPGPLTLIGIGLVACVYALAVSRERRELVDNRVMAGVLLASFVFVSQQAAIGYQGRARDGAAASVISALDAYRANRGGYPEELTDLVPDYLPELPRPRMGVLRDPDERFVYTNFGDSYGLEFASVQWVQCTYSPPFEYDEETGEPTDDVELPEVGAGAPEPAMEGSWNCESAPPKLY